MAETNYPASSLGGGMKYQKSGKSGLDVSSICVGAMSFGDLERWPRPWLLNQEESTAVVKHALDKGINWFDTANMYDLGGSEEYLGNALKKLGPNRDELVIQTKVSCKMAEGPNRKGSSRKNIMAEIDASLKRLQMDYVDVYLLHRWDWTTPIEETMEAMNDVVKAGKARYIGASSMYAWQFEKAYQIAKANHWANFICMQNHVNLIYREEEREMLYACEEEGVVCTPYSPLASGKLTDPWGTQTRRALNDVQVQKKYARTEAVDKPIVDRVEKLAKERGVSMAQIAMAWLLQKPPIQAPILGVTENYMIDEAIAAVDLQLTKDEITYLEELYVPHKMMGPAAKDGSLY